MARGRARQRQRPPRARWSFRVNLLSRTLTHGRRLRVAPAYWSLTGARSRRGLVARAELSTSSSEPTSAGRHGEAHVAEDHGARCDHVGRDRARDRAAVVADLVVAGLVRGFTRLSRTAVNVPVPAPVYVACRPIISSRTSALGRDGRRDRGLDAAVGVGIECGRRLAASRRPGWPRCRAPVALGEPAPLRGAGVGVGSAPVEAGARRRRRPAGPERDAGRGDGRAISRRRR